MLQKITKKYFESLESLAYIARDIRRIHNELIKEISQGSFKLGSSEFKVIRYTNEKGKLKV